MQRKVVFYDGDCGFCNRSIQLILNYEKTTELFFCALQSKPAELFFEKHQLPKPDLSTLVFFDGKHFSVRSTAVLKIAGYLKFPKNLARIGWIVPAFIRNAVYRQVAKRRYSIMNPSCLLPTPEQQKRFLIEKWW